jgi:hypothetical protein
MIWPPLLLADPSPCLRWRVVRDLLDLPSSHPEAIELAALRQSDPLAVELLTLQRPDGAWDAAALSRRMGGGTTIHATSLALARLGFLGFDRAHPAVAKAAGYLFDAQQPDGSWPLQNSPDEEVEQGAAVRKVYDMMPLQTAFPLRGLAAVGFAEDPRCERAFDWLLSQRLPDGAWPTGMASGVHGYVAGYRRLPHSRWGCRSNTTGALLCFSFHPQRRQSPEARQALDHLLGRETREREALGFEVSRLVGAEPFHGFISFYARFDLAILLYLCSRIGASPDDERVSSLREFILAQQGPYGLWQYPGQPQVSRWLSLDLLCSLSNLEESAGWVGIEPRTPFQPYPKKKKRF